MQAVSILRIQLGAEKPVNPLPVAGDKTKMPLLAGTLPLVDGTGLVYRVCDEAPGDLAAYLTQRATCKDGSMTLLRAIPSPAGLTLNLVKPPHDSDLAFQLSYPKLWVEGEAELRAEQSLQAFAKAVKSLPTQALEDFAAAMAAVNRTFSELPIGLRQSEKVAQALTPNDEALVPLFALIGESKVRVAGTRLEDQKLVSLLHRSESLVFADMTPSGNIELNASSALSELITRDALPKAFLAYNKKLDKLRKQVEKRKLDNFVDLDESAQLKEYTHACSAARGQLLSHQTTAETCLLTATTCETDKRRSLTEALQATRDDWYKARMAEIIANASAAQSVVPSKECSGI